MGGRTPRERFATRANQMSAVPKKIVQHKSDSRVSKIVRTKRGEKKNETPPKKKERKKTLPKIANPSQ